MVACKKSINFDLVLGYRVLLNYFEKYLCVSVKKIKLLSVLVLRLLCKVMISSNPVLFYFND